MTGKRFNCHFKFSAMPNGMMVLDYERHGDEQTVIEDISREKAHRVMDRLNELNDENEQLKQYKQSVNDVLKSWSQKNVTAKQLQVVLAIMEELNVIGDVE